MKEKSEPASETTPWVTFRLGTEEFGADVSSVLEISRMLEMTKIPEGHGLIEGVVNLRGQVIAVIDLARRFGLRPQAEYSKKARIVVVQVGSETVGLLVDEVPEIIRIAQDDIEPTPEVKRDYIRGIGKVGSRLIVLLDLNKILMPEEIQTLGERDPEGGEYGQRIDRR